jgi:hypothetical protein
LVYLDRLEHRLNWRRRREEGLKDLDNTRDLRLDDLQSICRVPIQLAILQEKLDVTGNRVEGVADLVSHHGGQLPGHRQPLRPAELPLYVEEHRIAWRSSSLRAASSRVARSTSDCNSLLKFSIRARSFTFSS